MQLFGLRAEPFLADPLHPFLDPSRRDALDRLQALVDRRGLAVLCGPPGCGKTLLLAHLISRLNPNTHRFLYLPDADARPPDFLRTVCLELDLEPPLGRARTLRRIAQRLAELKAIAPLLVLDEAQRLPVDTFDTLRTLVAALDGRSRFAVILAGTDALLDRLALRLLEPLRQRVTLYLHLQPLSRALTHDYLHDRLQAAGGPPELHAPDALNLIFELTSGLPRLIDSLAAEALREAARLKQSIVSIDHVHAASQLVLPLRQRQDRP